MVILMVIFVINLAIGLLPYIDNFSSIGGFVSGFLLGFILLFTPKICQVPHNHNKAGLYEYKVSISTKLRQKLDRPILRSVSLVLFGAV